MGGGVTNIHQIETPKEAARRLAKSVVARGFRPEALHTYTDSTGQPIYWRIRLKHPETGEKWIRPMHRSGRGFELGEPAFNGTKSLYRLNELASAPDGSTVYVVEGEKSADALTESGVLATTSGGSDSARKTDWSPLKRHSPKIWRDNDLAGERYQSDVIREFLDLGISAQIIDVPALGLPEKGDAFDWFIAHPEATVGDIDALPIRDSHPEPTNAPKGDSECVAADAKTAKSHTAKALIELAISNCELFHDERGDGYAVTTHNGVRLNLRLRGREFRRWLARSYYGSTTKAANNEAISTALTVLEAKATFDGPQMELSNRFALRDGAIYVDMADHKWRVIEITENGWHIMDKPPVLFRRFSHQKPLPDPVRGGTLSDLHKHLAIKSDDDKRLVESWLVATAFSNIPRPAPTFHGPHGASKTTSARILKSITDPSITESVDLGKSPAELAQVLDHHSVPCFDNLTSIPSWAADMLCRAVSGGAFSKRELYSDDSDILMMFKRAPIITGINVPTHAPDLLDRLLLIELERIQPEKRVDETTFWKNFNSDRPKLFGALLDSIAGALRHLPDLKLERMPRMADFARVACAYAEHTEFGAEKMLDVIMRHSSRQTQEVLDADPLATAVVEFIRKRKSWTGTASRLLELLNESQPTPHPYGWPKQSNSLSRKLNVLHATLNEVGVSIRRDKEGSKRQRQLALESSPDSSSASSASSSSLIQGSSSADVDSKASSATSSSQDPRTPNALDDTDDEDDILAPVSGDSDSKSVVVRTV